MSQQEAQGQEIQQYVQKLFHALQCRDANCSQPNCQGFKRLVQHCNSCETKANGGCPVCKQLMNLCCYHAKHCNNQECPASFCRKLKNKFLQQQLQQSLQQALMSLRLGPSEQE